MTMTRDKIEQAVHDLVKLWDSQHVGEDDFNEEMCRIEAIFREFALAERALEPQGQALPEFNDAVKQLRSALSAMMTQFGMDEDETSAGTFKQARKAYEDTANMPDFAALYGETAVQNAELRIAIGAFGLTHEQAVERASQLALPAGPVPEGFVLVPMHLNAEMRDVLSEEDWTWEDLLVAANAVTEEQYYAIQNGDGDSPAGPVPALSRQQVFDKFSFLEGVVNEFYYRQIAETAIAMLAEQSPAVAQPVADEREGGAQ